MKNIKILLLALLTSYLVSCSDSFLETEVLTRITDENFYSTPDEVFQALVGCYDALQLIWSDGIALPVAATVKADYAFGGTGHGDGLNYRMIDEHDKTVSPGDLNMFEANWINYYRGIFRCNKLISRIDQANWGNNQALRNQMLAEARFLRAFFYFDLVRMFERVPLLTTESRENIPQAHPDEIYRVITEDLLFAAEHASSLSYQQIAPANHGRVNKWAAKSLLARVFLYYTGYYNQPDLVGLVNRQQALSHLEDVIANSGYGLVGRFHDLWPAASTFRAVRDGGTIRDHTYAGEINQEVIFAIRYTFTSDYSGNTDGNHWMVMNGIRGLSVPRYGYGNGWGASTVVPDFFNTWSVADQRRDASVMAIGAEAIPFTSTHINDMREYTGFFTKKYVPTCDENGASTAVTLGGVNFMLGQFQDYFVIRYADVLLMAAELGSVNALAYLNLVRSRAGLPPATQVTPEIIREERKYEFAFEGIRYWDLLRYDHTLEYAASRIAFSGSVRNGGNVVPKNINGNNIKITRGLFQIPYNQITLSNNVLVQNPGW